jgi:hypothetical protein
VSAYCRNAVVDGHLSSWRDADDRHPSLWAVTDGETIWGQLGHYRFETRDELLRRLRTMPVGLRPRWYGRRADADEGFQRGWEEARRLLAAHGYAVEEGPR